MRKWRESSQEVSDMPLTECPDCGGIVSDAALTCPTCHRVLAASQPPGMRLGRRIVCWAFGGLLALVGLWLITRFTA
ncbi:MAG: hypothetical protein KJO06_07030 [Gemmatimonadetes bacterium]|nr:hypothetical protein [Gemmatimonadota bacterium]